jgi:hypothetical protein
VLRYKDAAKKACYPAVLGDVIRSFDYGAWGTVEQQTYLGRYGRTFTYDQALAAITWLMSDHPDRIERARRLLAFLGSYQNWDSPISGAENGSFGFSFNNVGRFFVPNGNRDSFYDMDYLRGGATGWAGYSFSFYQRLTTDLGFEAIARRTGDYLLTLQVMDPEDPRYGLLKGGYGAWNIETWRFQEGYKEWVSTEHHIDAYFFLRDLGRLTGDSRYQQAASLLLLRIPRMWNERKGRLDQGIKQDCTFVPNEGDALDASSWGAMFWLAVGDLRRAERSLAFAEANYRSSVNVTLELTPTQTIQIEGYKPYAGWSDAHKLDWSNIDMVWSEGSLGVAMANLKLGQALASRGDERAQEFMDKAGHIVDEMIELQSLDPLGGVVYSWYDGAEIPDFPRAPSVAGTAWLLMVIRALQDPAVGQEFWSYDPVAGTLWCVHVPIAPLNHPDQEEEQATPTLVSDNACPSPTPTPIETPNPTPTPLTVGPLELTWSDHCANASRVRWVDWNQDGDLDLSVGSFGPTGFLYRNDGQCRFQPAALIPNTADINWGDLDGDGLPDLAVCGNGVRVYRNTGGALEPVPVWESPERDRCWAVAWGDWDNDGDPDLAVANEWAPDRVVRNIGGTLVSCWQSSEAWISTSLAWGDVDGDGDLDLAVGNIGNLPDMNSDGTPLLVYLNDGTRTCGPDTFQRVWESCERDRTWDVTWADVDNDGDLDLAAANGADVGCCPDDPQPNRIYLNHGGSLERCASISLPPNHSADIEWADLEGDGDMDLAGANWGYQPAPAAWAGAANQVHLNAGGRLDLAWTFPVWDHTFGVAWGDCDRDGDPDLAFANGWAQGVEVYRNSSPPR